MPGAIEPDEVAELTVTSLDGGPFLLLPHPEVARYYAGRAADPDAWLAGMRRSLNRDDQGTPGDHDTP